MSDVGALLMFIGSIFFSCGIGTIMGPAVGCIAFGCCLIALALLLQIDHSKVNGRHTS